MFVCEMDGEGVGDFAFIFIGGRWTRMGRGRGVVWTGMAVRVWALLFSSVGVCLSCGSRAVLRTQGKKRMVEKRRLV